MCGRLNVTDDEFVQQICISLGVDLSLSPLMANRFVKAAGPLQVIRQVNGERRLQQASWWLLLEPTEQGFKPSKYTSFNTRYDKLNVSGSAGYQAFRQSRCIIPAKGFGETEFELQGATKKPKHYHDMQAIDGALAFGGLCREYINRHTGETTLGCSIITLPPHAKLRAIHSKSSPLMLPQDSTLDTWLDPRFTNVEQFAPLLEPAIRQDLQVTQINKPSLYQAMSESFVITKD